MAIRTASKAFSFYFDQDDKVLLKYTADTVELPQSEIMRRLIRAYAAGIEIPGLPTCPPTKKAVEWTKKFTKIA